MISISIDQTESRNKNIYVGLPLNRACVDWQFVIHDFVKPAELLNHQPSQQPAAVRFDDKEHIRLLYLISISIEQRNETQCALVSFQSSWCVVVEKCGWAYLFFGFFNEFVVGAEKSFAQCFMRLTWIIFAGSNFTMQMRYTICSRIGSTMTIEYCIVAGCIWVLKMCSILFDKKKNKCNNLLFKIRLDFINSTISAIVFLNFKYFQSIKSIYHSHSNPLSMWMETNSNQNQLFFRKNQCV